MTLHASFSFASPWWRMSEVGLGNFTALRLIIDLYTYNINLIHWALHLRQWGSNWLSFLRFRLSWSSSCDRSLSTETLTSCSNFLFDPTETLADDSSFAPLRWADCGCSLGFFFFTLSGFGPFGPFLFRAGGVDVDVVADFSSGKVAWRICSSFLEKTVSTGN